ncbi:MAG: phospholipid carrier-dependent glycosyltransferase [Proteobacteria bacterium]|nr:phospholipid carrier-dependent glycosyltransferase [Pseudomonadota bacterium]
MTGWWRELGEVQRRSLLLAVGLALLCGWIYLAGHDRYGLFDVDEAIFTQATIEMRAHHSEGISALAMPTYNGEPRYHKPPLIYWLQDAAMAWLGEGSLYAARLPSALAALGCVLLLGLWLWRMTGDRMWALAASAALALNLSFLVEGRAATADGVLNFFSLALVLWLIYLLFAPKGVRGKRKLPWWRGWMTGALAALGFLAKGPVAWVPAAVVALLVLAARREKREVWKAFAVAESMLVAAAIVVPWALLLVRAHGGAFFYEFFVVQNVGRYAGGLSNTQSNSYFYYVLVLALGFFPWVSVVPVALRDGLRNWWRNLGGKDVVRALPPLCAIWAVFYVVFFSLSQTKLAHYIVPAYPALAVLVGWWLTRVPRGRMPGWLVGMAALIGLLMAGLALVANPLLEGLRGTTLHGWLGWLQVALDFKWPPKDALAFAVLQQPVMLGHAVPLAGVLLLLAVPLLVATLNNVRGALPALAGVWALCLGVIVWGVVPVVWAYSQAPLARLALKIEGYPRAVPVIHLGVHKPSVLYIDERPFVKLEKPLQLPDYLHGGVDVLVLTKVTEVAGIRSELAAARGVILAEDCDGGYCLLMVGQADAVNVPVR